MENFWIVAVFAFAFFCQSVFGFGGVAIAFSILGFFVEAKEIIFLGFIFSAFTKMIVFATDRRRVDFRVVCKIIFLIIPGLLLGAYFLKNLSSPIIAKFFAAFLILFSAQNLFLKNLKFPKFFNRIFLFFSGFAQGIFGTGGPFLFLGTKDIFKNKSQFRASIAAIFLLADAIRGAQYFWQKTFDFTQIANFWWGFPAIFVAVILGGKVHFKISENFFRVGISILVFISGVLLFLKN